MPLENGKIKQKAKSSKKKYAQSSSSSEEEDIDEPVEINAITENPVQDSSFYLNEVKKTSPLLIPSRCLTLFNIFMNRTNLNRLLMN